MQDNWKVPSLKNCQHCDKIIDRAINKRLRRFCSTECRTIYTQKEQNEKAISSGYSKKWQRERNDKRATHKEGTVQCDICGLWYKRVARHVNQRHGMDARSYKQENGYALGNGLLTANDHAHMREQVFLNETVDNLFTNKSIERRYTKNDKRTKEKSNMWGKKGAPKPNTNE